MLADTLASSFSLLLHINLQGSQFKGLLLTRTLMLFTDTQMFHRILASENRHRWQILALDNRHWWHCCWGWQWNTGVGSVHSTLTPGASHRAPAVQHALCTGTSTHQVHCAQDTPCTSCTMCTVQAAMCPGSNTTLGVNCAQPSQPAGTVRWQLCTVLFHFTVHCATKSYATTK